MSTPDRITKLIPRARPVTLAGNTYPIWEFQIRDLATLQGWLDDEWTDPLDAIEAKLLEDGLTAEQKDDILFDAHAIAEEGPPLDGSPEGDKQLATMAGLCAFILTALSRNRPKDTLYTQDEIDEITHIATNITRAEYAKLQRICYGASSLRVLTRKLLGYDAPGEGSGGWLEAIDDVARSHHWTYEYIYSLTITEFVNARREGKPVDETVIQTIRPDQAERYAAYLKRKYENGSGALAHV